MKQLLAAIWEALHKTPYWLVALISFIVAWIGKSFF